MATETEYIPLGRYVLVEKVTQESIISLDAVQSNDMFDLVVITVGPECKHDIKEGDILVCAAGVMALPLRDNLYIISDNDIVGVEKPVIQ